MVTLEGHREEFVLDQGELSKESHQDPKDLLKNFTLNIFSNEDTFSLLLSFLNNSQYHCLFCNLT